MLKRIFLIFILAFIFNFFWEHLHHVLYIHYQGDAITNYILFRAACFDALLITAFSLPFLYVDTLRKNIWFLALLLLIWAIGLEMFAIETLRWEYRDSMPLVPVLGTGLTPTIQLALLGYLSFRLSDRLSLYSVYKK
jgi:hypothetical protein